jgi:hypothetical protein
MKYKLCQSSTGVETPISVETPTHAAALEAAGNISLKNNTPKTGEASKVPGHSTYVAQKEHQLI